MTDANRQIASAERKYGSAMNRTAYEIIGGVLFDAGGLVTSPKIQKEAITEAQAALHKDLLEIVGEDDVINLPLDEDDDLGVTSKIDVSAQIKNNLRAELRTKITAYFGQTGEKHEK